MSGQLSLFGDLEVRPLVIAPEERVMAEVESVPSSVTGPEITVDQNACEGSTFLHSSANLDEEAERAPAATLGITEVLQLPTPLTTPEERFEKNLDAQWANSQDLAYSIVNIALPEDDESLFEDFASYEKACRLAATGHGSRPAADERFDRLAWCLGKMAFSKIEHDRGKVVRIETTVLDLALDLSFDEDELAELRQFGVRGASGERIASLATAIDQYVNRDIGEVIIPAATPETSEALQRNQTSVDEITKSTYIMLFDQLGVPQEEYPDFSNMDAIWTALLDAIGTDERRLDLVLSYSDITQKRLFKAAENDIETKRRLLTVSRKQLKRDLDGFYATDEWHRHRTFARYPVFLTDGALYLAEHGGACATSAFWLMDVIASYQGEKQMRRIKNPQLWKIECTGVGSNRSCVVTSGNNPEKPIIRQEIEYTNFLLNEYELYASLEPFDESGRLALIISLLVER
ncbi:MAG: DUF6876 family protein [Bacteroidota bacterium]